MKLAYSLFNNTCTLDTFIFIGSMPPRLHDPHEGVSGAAAYLQYWGQELYLEWCREQCVTPVSYAVFRARTLKRGRDWWCDATSSRPAN